MFNLLSKYSNDAKTAKSNKDSRFLTAILYLKPNTKLCPYATKGCLASCLNTAGRGAFSNVQQARHRKSRLLMTSPDTFHKLLRADINKHVAYCQRHGFIPTVRLNGTSDVNWFDIIADYPHVQFYDYTKDVKKVLSNRLPNYHLTYSHNEKTSVDDARYLLRKKQNIAIVFSRLPKTYYGTKVINGDKTDLRFLDDKGVIVGLTAKGKAKTDKSGFVVRA